MVVGESPGPQEDLKNRVFVGPTGSYLNLVVEQSEELYRDKHCRRLPPIRYTNAVRCFPDGRDVRKAVNYCRHHLEDEINAVQPGRIIAMGGAAMQAFAGEYLSVMQHSGGWMWHETDYGKVQVQFIPHPTAALRNKSFKRYWRRTALDAFVNPPAKRLLPHLDIDCEAIEDVDTAIAFLKRAVREYPLIAFDTEYNKKTNRLLCLSVAYDPNEVVVFPDYVCYDKEFIKHLTYLLRHAKDIVAQNWKFDARGLMSALGIRDSTFTFRENPPLDTSSFRRMHNSEQDSKLEIIEWLVGMGGHKEVLNDLMTGRTGTAFEKAYDKDPDTIMWYCGLDSVACHRLVPYFQERMNTEGLYQDWEDTIGPVGPTLYGMERLGLKVDTEAMSALDKQLKRDMAVELEAIRSTKVVRRLEAAGEFEEFNPNSTDQMRKLFFSKEGLGLKPIKLTKGGKSGKKQASTDKATREALGKKSKVIARINEFARLAKLQQTYVKGWHKRLSDYDTLHTSYRQDVARTGRLSSQDPNVQTLPRPVTVEARMLRDLIIAHFPELVIVEIDMSQMEIRQAAQESKDAEMLRCYRERLDVHRRTGGSFLGKDPRDVTKEERQMSKAINFGLLFGMRESGLVDYAWQNYKVVLTLQEAREARAAYFALYPGFRRYQLQTLANSRRTGEVWVNWVGQPIRRRWVHELGSSHPGKKSGAERIVFNTPIQGGASQYTLRALNSLFRLLLKRELPGVAGLVGTVHDSIWYLAWRDAVETSVRAVGHVMVNQPTQAGVPLEVDAKAGDSLGAMEEVKVNGVAAINILDHPKFPTMTRKLRRRPVYHDLEEAA
jgi:uracil-DNA glycosylase family 4